jgi:hypothetical protein
VKDKKQAWTELSIAAVAYAATREAVQSQALATAADAWAESRGWRPPREAGAKPGGDLVLNFSRSKGKPVSEAATEDLQWVVERLHASIADPEKARFRAKDEALLEAVEAELEGRA